MKKSTIVIIIAVAVSILLAVGVGAATASNHIFYKGSKICTSTQGKKIDEVHFTGKVFPDGGNEIHLKSKGSIVCTTTTRIETILEATKS